MAQSKKNYFNKYSSIYYLVKIATVEKFAGGEKMKNVYTEKGKNYLIKRDREVKLTDYEITGDREIQDTLNKEDTFANIKKINKYEYELIDTGERRRYRLGVNKRKEGLRRSMKNLRQILKNNFIGGNNELFITLTTEKDTPRIREIKEEYQRFWKEIKKMYPDMEFVAVFEKAEDRDSWHIHSIIKAVNHKELYIPNKIIEEVWGKGYTKTSRITDLPKENVINEKNRMVYKDVMTERFAIDKVISYMCKTETKEEVPSGERCYETSKGIKRPTIRKVQYAEIREQMGKKYKLKEQYTRLIRNALTDAIVNKVKTEIWQEQKENEEE